MRGAHNGRMDKITRARRHRKENRSLRPAVCSDTSQAMKRQIPPLRYREEDHVLLDVDQLSVHARVSRAFVRLCITLGCPTVETRISQAMLLDWMFENYDAVRRASGLKEMATLDGVPAALLMRLKMGNALLTLLEYSEQRSSDTEEKERIRKVYEMVSIALDR